MWNVRIRNRRLLWLVPGTMLVAAAGVSRPGFHILNALWGDRDERVALPALQVDDASRMNATQVAEVWSVPTDTEQADTQLADLLRRAHREGLKVSIGGARHSMGGHTIYPDGILIDMRPFKHMELDIDRKILRVQAGALWADTIAYLDPLGYSVAVMQSNNSFSVGGSISVNCHGWQHNRPPIASTVESLRLMQWDGSMVRCSRDENRDLFLHVLGGYGLFGVILEVELRVVPNECYRLTQYVVPIDEALATYRRVLSRQPAPQMVYARLNIVPDSLFEEAIINVLTPEPLQPIPELSDPKSGTLTRAIFRGSADSDYGKQFRWSAETNLQRHLTGTLFSRNQLLNESTELLENRSAGSTDILHEYFVPLSGVIQFVNEARRVIQRHPQDLLNVTIREVNADADTVLRYADQDMIAFVMLFAQPRTPEADAAMERMTHELIDAALAARGRYYLPYRLHASIEQFELAYPQSEAFFAKKRQYDPHELFQNAFYTKYGRLDASGDNPQSALEEGH